MLYSCIVGFFSGSSGDHLLSQQAVDEPGEDISYLYIENFFILGALPVVGACSLVATEAFAAGVVLMHRAKDAFGNCWIARLANMIV